MKRFIILFALCLSATAGVQAQINDGAVKISGFNIEETGDIVTVSFTAEVAAKAVKRNYSMVYSPVLTDGNYRISLNPVIVEGRKAKIIRSRRELATGESLAYEKAVYIRNGEKVNYSASVESQSWMQGATIGLESALFGCCSALSNETKQLAGNLDFRNPVMESLTIVPERTEESVFTPKTFADTLAVSFPFVVDVSDFDPDQPFKIYDDERDNALIVYYRLSSSTIDPGYRGNEQILTNLTSVVSMIMDDANSEVEKIVVGGFASPDGNYEINDRLAFERAVSVKEHIVKTTGMPDRNILIFNGSVDWRGLRYMIAQTNILERDEIIRIIDEVPIWDAKNQRGRLGELMRLNGGVTYRYLLSEFFPLLRNGAFIKVYYKNK